MSRYISTNIGRQLAEKVGDVGVVSGDGKRVDLSVHHSWRNREKSELATDRESDRTPSQQ